MTVLDHPCFHAPAKGRWGRIHLPVAPDCNIQCNYCNRCYDCANESRPGVTSRVLEPCDVVSFLNAFQRSGADISVVGIAGPGDALSDPERTLETIRAVRRAWPGILICLSTNGLNLPEHLDELTKAGVTHVTVTVNAVDPSVGEKIYAWVRVNGLIYRGREAAELLLSCQKEALVRLKRKAIAVKVNTVILPGINDGHVRTIAATVTGLGVDVMNCLPVIPVAGTPCAGLEPPSADVLRRIRHIASQYVPQLNHCQRCRSDAVGLL
ncbi:MAG: radical SAM protein [Deltaproteobacteria bacterium]|nr:radical SAM protein [Deltaproteobacteria bacterium]